MLEISLSGGGATPITLNNIPQLNLYPITVLIISLKSFREGKLLFHNNQIPALGVESSYIGKVVFS